MTSVRSHRTPSRRRMLAPVLAILFAIALVPVGCGDDEATSEAGGADDAVEFAELREAAEKMQAEAEAAGATEFASETFEKGVEYLAKAEEYESESASKAKARYRSAKSKFEEARDDAEKNKGKIEEFRGELAEYEALRTTITAAGHEKIDPPMFEKAENNYASAKELGEGAELSKAKRKLRYAMEDLRRLSERASVMADRKTLADQERSEVASAKAKATEAGAENLAKNDWQWGIDQEKDAQVAYDAGQYDQAVNLYRRAQQAFTSAATYAQQQLDATVANTSARPDDDGLAHDGSGSGDVPGVDEIEIPDITGDDGADLSDLPSLFSGSASWDDSIFSIEWYEGTEFRNDIEVLAGRVDNVIFEGEENVGSGQDGYVLAGNTGGFVMIDAAFEDGVQIEADVQFQLVLSKAFFEIVFMADSVKDFYASEFASNVNVISDGKKYQAQAAAQPNYRRQFKDWVNLREPYNLKVVYQKANEEAEGEIRCYLNGEETSRYKTEKYRKGKIGLRWFNTKFIVKSLKVSGWVDEEWAKEALAARGSGETEKSGEDFGF